MCVLVPIVPRKNIDRSGVAKHESGSRTAWWARQTADKASTKRYYIEINFDFPVVQFYQYIFSV